MKKNTHPEYHDKAKVACACGNTFEVGSTLKKINVEICSKCHPFYTGKMKFIDTAKRVDKFKAKLEKTQKVAGTRKGKKAKRAARKAKKTDEENKDEDNKEEETKTEK